MVNSRRLQFCYVFVTDFLLNLFVYLFICNIVKDIYLNNRMSLLFRRISDRSLKRADLVKILKELTKMFQVDSRRRGFALAMNTDMFNAVVYTLEFKVTVSF